MSQSIGDLSLRCHFIKNKRSDGVNRLIDVYNNSTDEEKKLLSNECKIHFECWSVHSVFILRRFQNFTVIRTDSCI